MRKMTLRNYMSTTQNTKYNKVEQENLQISWPMRGGGHEMFEKKTRLRQNVVVKGDKRTKEEL